MHDPNVPTLDPSEIRLPLRGARAIRAPVARRARARRRGWVAAGLAGTAVLAAAGYGAAEFGRDALWPRPAKSRAGEIRMGRLPDMPDIVDGVPALVTRRPAVTAAAPALTAPAPTPAASPGRLRQAAASLPPSDAAVPRDDETRALAMTVEAAGLRPGFVDRSAREASAEPAAAPVDMRPPVPAAATAEAVPPARAASGPADAAAIEQPSSVASLAPAAPADSAPARVASPPLPPVRETARPPESAVVGRPARPASAAQAPPAAQVVPAPQAAPAAPARPKVASRPPAAAAPASPRPVPNRTAQAEPAGRPAPAAPAREEGTDILGVPVPGFVPAAGRRIRDAADTITSTVTSIPDLF